MGDFTAASAADAAPHASASAAQLAVPDRLLGCRGGITPRGLADDDRTSSVADPQLMEVGATLQYIHRRAEGGDGCAAGCRGSMPCRGQRLGAHVLEAAIGPWHVRQTIRTDLVSGGVLAAVGAPHGADLGRVGRQLLGALTRVTAGQLVQRAEGNSELLLGEMPPRSGEPGGGWPEASSGHLNRANALPEGAVR